MAKFHFFNTTGPCNPADHYMLPPEDRLVGAQLHRYVEDKLYWVLHAPRQTGKTTFLKSWAREINAGGAAVACYVSVEDCQNIADSDKAMLTIYQAICDFAKLSGIAVPSIEKPTPAGLLRTTLIQWAERVAPKPLIVLFDEVDVLVDNALVSFLRQLRGGFADRGTGQFPVSIALVGMRDLKDYIMKSKDGQRVNPGSPFNIKVDSASLSNFSKDDVMRLFAQRTEETGQQITQEALDYVYDQSKGQPWIVNSLFARVTLRLLDANSAETVTIELVREARQQMIDARETHLDALGERLRDPKIKHVIQTIMTGAVDPDMGRTNPNVESAMDLGLITWSTETGFIIANPIYEEIMTRYLNSGYHDNMPPPSTWQWQKPDGTLDMDKLLKEFQRFWRLHSEIWEQRADYTEAFPHLLLMAFLQRVTNGGGCIDREYAAGRGRMDLTIEYMHLRYIIEVKLIHSHDTPKAVKAEGLEQVRLYRDRIDAQAPAYLILFDRKMPQKKSWEKRISWSSEGDITVVGC
jgi:hypothetical protein